MANFLEGLGNLLIHPINEAKFLWEEGVEDVGKNLIRGNFSEAWDEFKGIPGEHNRMMRDDITVPLFGHNKLSENPDAVAGAIVGSIFAAPALAGMAGGGKGAVSSLGSSDFATGSFGGGKFGDLNFGGPSFSGGVPEINTDIGVGSGTTDVGGWKPTVDWGDIAGKNSSLPWGDMMKSVGDVLSKMETKDAKLIGGHRPGFSKPKLPASQFDAGALQGVIAGQDWNRIGTGPAPVTGKQREINNLLGLSS